MKKQLFLLNLCLVLALPGFASNPLFPLFIMDKFKQKNVQKTRSVHDEYVNFSGFWTGSCDNDPDDKQTITIEQGADSSSILIDNNPFKIDSISTTESNSNFEIENAIAHYRWNEDGQQLVGTLLHNYKAGNMSQGNFFTSVGKFSWAIEKEQLIISYALSYFKDGTFLDNSNFRCVYSKSEQL